VSPHFGVDHDYPKPLLDAAKDYLPFDVTAIREIDVRLVDRMDDWQVILALSQEGFAGLITLDTRMLNSPREMAVTHQTAATIVAIDAAGHNPLRAFGQLLVHATGVAAAYLPDRPQLFRIPQPRTVQPVKAWDQLGVLASDARVSIQQLFDRAKLDDRDLGTRVLGP